MKTALAILILCSTAVAGDCRHVGQVYAVRQNVYGHGYVKAAIIAIEDPYHVDVIAPELRAKQRAKEQAAKIESLEEISRQNTEALRLLTQAMLANKGQEPGVLQSQADPVIPILNKHCAKCHTGDGSKGDVKLFEAGGSPVQFTPQLKLLVESVTNDNSMPPSGEKLSTEEYQAVRKWMEVDRAAIRAAIKGKSPVPQAPGELK